jgi:hypothetical protein
MSSRKFDPTPLELIPERPFSDTELLFTGDWLEAQLTVLNFAMAALYGPRAEARPRIESSDDER